MVRSKLIGLLLSISILIISCQANSQHNAIIYQDTLLKYTITQGDLDKYISYRNIKDTVGKNKELLEILNVLHFQLDSKFKINNQLTYEEAVNRAEDVVKRRHMVNKVLVLKSKRKMYLLKDDKTIKTFNIALGPNPVGQKEYEGDGRTPEGLYTLDWQRWETSTFHSFHISYPNDADLARAKSKNLTAGSNIMVHGTSKGKKKKKDWTNGCIALSNVDMQEFRSIVFQDTPIEIRK
ncbi:L,D-transpeptidase family protein [Pedobacter montanisoli]|uniref:L,D-transpeptidase family protein n=1 Tax=Pedobacter montanisoli TaxID=2923277 RepID=A0ABS9ZYX8_9SPHI|nr:L,D-transpeptidase family protein [Pedobacter montanisoli]MCJ0743494.1 L,D-transpeptidase family protein [Pedobacter montanisoli]